MLRGADVIVRGFTARGRAAGREYRFPVVADSELELWTKIATHAASYRQSRTEAVRIVVDVAVDEVNRRVPSRAA